MVILLLVQGLFMNYCVSELVYLAPVLKFSVSVVPMSSTCFFRVILMFSRVIFICFSGPLRVLVESSPCLPRVFPGRSLKFFQIFPLLSLKDGGLCLWHLLATFLGFLLEAVFRLGFVWSGQKYLWHKNFEQYTLACCRWRWLGK